MFSILKNPHANMAEVLAKSEKYINGKKPSYQRKQALQTVKKKAGLINGRDEAQKTTRSERFPKKDSERSPKRRGSLRDGLGPPQPERQQHYSPRWFTPLMAAVSQVLREVQHEQFLRWPSQMRSDQAKKDNIRYCEFHMDYGHRTDDCIQLGKEIEYLFGVGISDAL